MNDKITIEMLRNFAKELEARPRILKPARLPVSQQLYNAAPPEWKPLLIVTEKMPEPTPVERGVLARRRVR
jgi:hypothetical protein